ncbi:molybdate ABC transporter substrate-binding protein [Demequina sp.]|uniref:molybdate ABC transporter substrate-binding protein n=1 Tax=Demequina sp. TaxID=2050685 RepID=UPI0025C36B07|nr:molybdate ABC transporter substrate-binding protein [Demequina sp.]
MTARVALLACAAALVLSACGGTADASPPTVGEITVAAASDLRPVFEELGEAFEAETGTRVTFSFGSSGQLREQILGGAPFDLFASANVEFVDDVIEAGRGVAATKADYAFGRIVLWAPAGVALPRSIEDLTAHQYRRVAIANPEHAPYGLAAQQALQSAGVYEQVQSRLVYGENISDTFRIAQSGNADVGMVALSLAIADGSDYTVIPADLHEPLEQALVVTSTGPRGETATAFADMIGSPAGREVMARYGFVLPGGPPGKQG